MDGRLFVVGLLAFFTGAMFSLPGMGGRSRGYGRVGSFGSFSGPVWFVLIGLGVAIMASAALFPG